MKGETSLRLNLKYCLLAAKFAIYIVPVLNSCYYKDHLKSVNADGPHTLLFESESACYKAPGDLGTMQFKKFSPKLLM